QDDQYFLDCTILSAHGDDFWSSLYFVNSLILQAFPGHERVHLSSDLMVDHGG
ncbi:hypothetical protein PAXRUDRAFT_156603, partial [Paxillus rubicundulus Ve08.2h10]